MLDAVPPGGHLLVRVSRVPRQRAVASTVDEPGSPAKRTVADEHLESTRGSAGRRSTRHRTLVGRSACHSPWRSTRRPTAGRERSPDPPMTSSLSQTPAAPAATRARAPDGRPRRRPGGADRRLPARQARPAGHRARGRGPGGRAREDGRARRLPLRPRRPPLLHEGEGGRAPLARGHGRRVPPAPAHVAHLLERQVPRLPAARPGRDARSSARSSSRAVFASYVAAAVRPKGHEETSRTGSRTASAGGSSSSSSGPTPRRSGASRPRRSAPSGPRSASRGSRSSRAAKAAFFGNEGNKVKSLIQRVPLPALRARARCGRR